MTIPTTMPKVLADLLNQNITVDDLSWENLVEIGNFWILRFANPHVEFIKFLKILKTCPSKHDRFMGAIMFSGAGSSHSVDPIIIQHVTDGEYFKEALSAKYDFCKSLPNNWRVNFNEFVPPLV